MISQLCPIHFSFPQTRSLVQTLPNQQSLVWSFFTVGPVVSFSFVSFAGLSKVRHSGQKQEGYLTKYKSNGGHHLSPTFPFCFFFVFLFCQPKDQPFSFISCKLNETYKKKKTSTGKSLPHSSVGGWWRVGVQIWQGRKFVFFIYHRRRR